MQFLKQDLVMTQVLEGSKEKTYRISVGKFPCIQIQLTDTLLNQQKYPYNKFLEIYWIFTQKLIKTLRKIYLFKRMRSQKCTMAR